MAGIGSIGGLLRAAVAAAWLCALVLAAPAAATPVADNDEEYTALGRVFPDPLANCQRGGEGSPCSPFAQGNVPATQFIGHQEFIAGMRYLNSKDEWRRYLEVWPLDGKMGEGSGTKVGGDMFPGNNLGKIEFTPRPDHQSAGLATSQQGRSKSDLYVVRVTDESVPDAGKKRYALSLSIHGIERAGAEGGIRAIEDLVTAARNGTADRKLLPAGAGPSPTFGEALRKTIIYFTLPNPDGWRRGSVSEGGVFFQRYNGNGMDVNRDWPDIGFSHRFYTANSEPETRAFSRFFRGVEANHGQYAAGDDLHGQPFADALSYTMMPHGRHDWPKNERLKQTAIKINAATNSMVSWSPIVQPNNAPRGGGAPCSPDVLGSACAKIYGQTWGTVYDTINYTTAGTLGDWFDSTEGLNADGISNEMSFSHLDRNINFDPHTEQMHVDGNKALIWSHVTSILDPPDQRFDAPGRKGYVPNQRLKRSEKTAPKIPEGTVAQDSQGDLAPEGEYGFTVKGGAQPDGKTIYNGGMRIQATAPNAQGVGTGSTQLTVQCQGCDAHTERKTDTDDEWVTVGEDFNQSPIYAQAGVTVAINQPQAFYDDKGKAAPVKWRALVRTDGVPTPSRVDIEFSSEPASDDGNTGGDPAPRIAGYDLANTDIFRDLSDDMAGGVPGFEPVDPREVAAGRKSLAALDSLVLADDALPGYKRPFAAESIGPPPADFDISWSPTVPGAYNTGGVNTDPRVPGTYTMVPFEIRPDQAAGGLRVRIDWLLADNDFDMYLYRKLGSGKLILVGSSTSTQGTTNFEEINLRGQVPAGNYELYVDNYAAAEPRWEGKVSFSKLEVPTESGSYSDAEKNQWFAKLRQWVEGGGNLVLTDGALRALPELLPSVPFAAVAPATVYAGQVTFAKDPDESTVKDPLAQKPISIEQPGSRFNSGGRRQTYEPTPLGFAIQQDTRGNDDTSFARQWDVDKKIWEAAGGRTAGTSVDSGARDAGPVHERVALGELALGKGTIRIAGGLLPQPSTEYNHPLGVEPYSLTYTGYILLRNLLEVPSILSSPTIDGRFLISGRAVKMRKNAAAVRVSCRKPFTCRGTLKLQTTIRVRSKKTRKISKKRITLGKVKFKIGNKQRNRILQVPIAKSSRKYVLRTRRVQVLATAPIKFHDGKRGTARNDFWFYRPTSRALRKRR